MFIVFTGTTLEVDLDLNETGGLVQAMSEQAPAHNIVEASGKRHVVNMRQVLCLQIEPGQPDSGAPEETGEAATPSADDLAALTKAKLTEVLSEAGVEHDPKAPKAELVQVAVDNNVTPPAPAE